MGSLREGDGSDARDLGLRLGLEFRDEGRGFRALGVGLSSYHPEAGIGGASFEVFNEGWGLLGRDRDLDRDERRRASGIPKRLCIVFLVTEDLGVVGREEDGAAFSRICCCVGATLGVGSAEAGRLGVAVELVVDVVDERGREGIRDAGLEPLGVPGVVSGFRRWSRLARCMRSGLEESESWCSCFDRERDLERVRKLYIWTTTWSMSGCSFVGCNEERDGPCSRVLSVGWAARQGLRANTVISCRARAAAGAHSCCHLAYAVAPGQQPKSPKPRVNVPLAES